jgi:hypothetical protein
LCFPCRHACRQHGAGCHASRGQVDAVRAARESVALTLNQYKAGTVSYLNVVTVQATLLVNERTAVGIKAGGSRGSGADQGAWRRLERCGSIGNAVERMALAREYISV